MHVKDHIRRLILGCGVVVLTSLVAGCAGGLNPEPANYDKLPGSGDRMADGPGLIGSQSGSNYEGGYTIYSDDPSKQALIHPNGSRQPSGTPQRMAAQNGAQPAAASQPTAAQQRDYREFQQFQQFKRFQQMPEDSPERQRFEDWKQWKQYEQWRSNGQDSAR